MPTSIPILAIPTQQITTNQDNHQYIVLIRTIANGVTLASITRDAVLIVENVRLVANRLMMPHLYQEGVDGGNFFLSTDATGDELPDYTLFGNTQSLLYFSNAELAAARAAA